jgi:hypothetical protein
MPRDNPARALERSVVGALRSAIRDNGPITPENMKNAAKRIIGKLRNARVRTRDQAHDLCGELKGRYRIGSGIDL